MQRLLLHAHLEQGCATMRVDQRCLDVLAGGHDLANNSLWSVVVTLSITGEANLALKALNRLLLVIDPTKASSK